MRTGINGGLLKGHKITTTEWVDEFLYKSGLAMGEIERSEDRIAIETCPKCTSEGFIWIREGERRRVPLSVYCNADRLRKAYITLAEFGHKHELPPDAQYIFWDQAVPMEESYQEVSLEPHPFQAP